MEIAVLNIRYYIELNTSGTNYFEQVDVADLTINLSSRAANVDLWIAYWSLVFFEVNNAEMFKQLEYGSLKGQQVPAVSIGNAVG
jgi:hypothetical protein